MSAGAEEGTVVDEGVTAGLKLWLFFLLCFFFLGYSVPLSLCLGAAGGLAGGWIVAWWQGKAAQKPPEPQQPKETTLQRMRSRWQKWQEIRLFGLFRPGRNVYKRRRRSSRE